MSTPNENKELNELLANKVSSSGDLRRHMAKMAAQHDMGCEGSTCEMAKRELGNLVQWTTSDEKVFVPASHTKPVLLPGVYEIKHSPSIGIYFQKIPVKTEGLIRFPQTNSERVVREIQNFWEKENIFREFRLSYKRGIILWGPAGCHGVGTEILMHDGTVKKVEDVQVGDILMGPDSKPRRVLELRSGRDEMYRITPNKGEPFVVNKHHVLSLRRSSVGEKNYPEVLNISLGDYLLLSEPAKKRFKLRRVALAGKPNKDQLLTGFYDIEHLGEGNYYGFILSGDHLYLTSDFVVHHNSGKSSTIQLIMKDVVERHGIVIKFTHPGIFMEGMRIFREIEGVTPVVVLMEDIDSILENYSESDVLNIIDGVDQIERTIFLATTNYPERLGGRILNRPSRFDKRFKIDHPNAESRMMYFKHLFGEGQSDKLGINLTKWVEDTERFSIAHLKELFVAVVILGDDYAEAIETLESMKEVISSEDDRDKTMGFGR